MNGYILATFMFKGCAFIVFEDGSIYRISPDYQTRVRIEKVADLPYGS